MWISGFQGAPFRRVTGTSIVLSLELQSVLKVDAKLRIVTHLPLRELWQDDGLKTTARIRSLTEDDIRSLLRSGKIQFVVVDVGAVPRWIQPNECFQFWKNEAQPRLAREARVILDDFPGGYCYFASPWDGGDPASPIVVLEKQH